MGCDLACKTKIILNGNNTARMLENLCYVVGETDAADIGNEDELIDILNKMEELAGDAQALFLKGIGYNGKLPRGLKPAIGKP